MFLWKFKYALGMMDANGSSDTDADRGFSYTYIQVCMDLVNCVVENLDAGDCSLYSVRAIFRFILACWLLAGYCFLFLLRVLIKNCLVQFYSVRYSACWSVYAGSLKDVSEWSTTITSLWFVWIL